MTDEAKNQFEQDFGAKSMVDSATRVAETATRAALREKNMRQAGKAFLVSGIKSLAREGIEKVSAQTPYHHRSDVISVYEQMNDKYGQDWWDWEPETVRETLDREYGVDLGDDGVNVIGALQVILNTNQAHEHWHVFEKVGHAFNGNHVDFSVIQPLEMDEIALSLSIMNTIRPKQEFMSEIFGYIASCAKMSGLVYLPEEFFGSDPQQRLDTLNNDLELKKRVASLWKNGSDGDAFDEQIQSRRLSEIRDYLEGS